MAVYLVFISVTFLSPIMLKSIIKDPKKANVYALGISAVLLFLIFALRAPSIGRDIVGYKDMYENLASNSRYDTDTYWTEKGYEMLEIFFGRTLKANWQVFLAFCSAVPMLAYFLLIKRYSKDPTFSMLVYMFMGYMMLDMSAVRTMLSVGICLFVVPLFEKKGVWPYLVVTLVVIFVATQFHSSAYVFYLLFLLYKIPINSISVFFFATLPVFFFAFRDTIMRWAIRSFKSSAVDKGVSLGGSVLLYALIIVFAVMLFVISRYEKGMSLKNIGKIDPKTKQRFHLKNAFSDLDSATLLAFRMLYAGVIFTVFTGDNIFVRMAEYGLVFTIILIPNLISQLEIKSRFFTKYMVLGALGAYFYLYGVRANDLLCFPYKFFWNA